MKTYTALTIGPIYKTISRMKKVREIWGASYIFSKFMRLIIKELLGSIDQSDFLVPYIDDELVNNKEKYKGIGFFHDRLIFQTPADQNGLEILNSAIEKALNIISEDIKGEQESRAIITLLQIVSPTMWHRIEESARIRVENMILKSMKDGEMKHDSTKHSQSGALATWATEFFSSFTLQEELVSTSLSLLKSGNEHKRRYFSHFFLHALSNTIYQMGRLS